jgi:hypothetical protein
VIIIGSRSFSFFFLFFFFFFSFFCLSSLYYPFLISVLSLLSSDDAKKKERKMKKRKNVDKEEATIHTCVFHGLMMHGEAKQNRQQSIFCLTHYTLRGRVRYREEKNAVLTCDINIVAIAVKTILFISQLYSKTTYSI